MNDTKLYEQMLGLQSPWSVQAVTLKKDEGTIEVEVTCAGTMWGCPQCGQRMHVPGVNDPEDISCGGLNGVFFAQNYGARGRFRAGEQAVKGWHGRRF